MIVVLVMVGSDISNNPVPVSEVEKCRQQANRMNSVILNLSVEYTKNNVANWGLAVTA